MASRRDRRDDPMPPTSPIWHGLGVEVRGDFALNSFNSRAERDGARALHALAGTDGAVMEDMPGERRFDLGRALVDAPAPLSAAWRKTARAARRQAAAMTALESPPIDGMALIDRRRGAAFPCGAWPRTGAAWWRRSTARAALAAACPNALRLFRAGCCPERAGELLTRRSSRCSPRRSTAGRLDLRPFAGMQTTTGAFFRGVE